MRSVSILSSCLLSLVVFFSGAHVPVAADWQEGDGYKMHWPQLPDPNGWDIRVTNSRRELTEPLEWIVADDWLCIESGPVSGIHFWVSWMQEVQDPIVNLHLSIHSDVPRGPDGWSTPGQELWARDFSPNEFALITYGRGDQGWIDPQNDEWRRDDHQLFYQINVEDIADPFIQREGQIYWLDVSVDLWGEAETGQLGWKTSGSRHFLDDAVYWDLARQKWMELRDPITQDSIDMAFVIVPEPGSFILLGIGILGLFVTLRRGRGRK